MEYFTEYTLVVPKDNLDQYNQHVLKRIYSLTIEDLWFLHSTHSNDHKVKLLDETDETYTIQFSQLTNITTINVLPKTIISPNCVFYTDQNILTQIKQRIASIIGCYHMRMGAFHNDIFVPTYDISDIVKQLTIDTVIQTFVPLNHTMYLCLTPKNDLFVIGGKNDKLLTEFLLLILDLILMMDSRATKDVRISSHL